MNKKRILIVIIGIVIALAGGGYWWGRNQGLSITDTVRVIVGKEKSFDVNDPGSLFEVAVPEDMNDAEKQRLGDKINLSKTLYDTKKDETWTWITIGNMYEFAEDYDRAIAAYTHASDLNASEYISRMNIAYIYENYKEEYTKAEEYYKKVIEINPNNPDNFINLARLYEFKMQKRAEAEEVYIDGLTKTKNNSDLIVTLIRFYQRQNNSAKVTEYSKLLLSLYPDNDTYRQEFADFVK